MKKIIVNILNIIFKMFRVENNFIVFFSSRNRVDGNPREIYLYLKKNYNTKFKIKYLINKNTIIDDLDIADICYYKSLKSLYYISKAKYWILSDSVNPIINKKKKQIYIQTFHGHGPVKKGGFEIKEYRDSNPIKKAKHVKDWDIYISMCEEDEKHMIDQTGYDQMFSRIGIPSTDPIVRSKNLSKEEIDRIKDKYNIPKDKIVVLYAPTYRNELLDMQKIDLKIESLKSLNNYVFLLRLHPLLNSKTNKDLFNNANFINCEDVADIVDLYPITDILISDYSASIYEFALTGKKIILYPYDYDKYSKYPGIVIDYKKVMPGPICYTEEELYNILLNMKSSFRGYDKKIKEFNQKYNYLNDGYATKRFVDNLINGKYDIK